MAQLDCFTVVNSPPLCNNKFHFINTLRPRQNGRHFAEDIFKRIFVNENVWISIKISLKFVPKGSINNIPTLVQIMAWCRLGDKPLSELMMVRLLMHVCVTVPQWVEVCSHMHRSVAEQRWADFDIPAVLPQSNKYTVGCWSECLGGICHVSQGSSGSEHTVSKQQKIVC